MKIIDLLNKIANGEEVPKKVKYCGEVYDYINIYKEGIRYINLEKEQNDDYRMLIFSANKLNDEVEIIEEEKKIPEKLESYISCGWNGTCKDLKRDELFEDLKKIGNKINEIIDYLKSKGE